MKLRNGFVSNSSSSSFIVAAKVEKPCKHCGRSEPSFLDCLPPHNFNDWGDTELCAEGLEEIVKRIRWSLEENFTEEEEKSLRADLKPYNNKRWRLATIEISYHDETLNKEFEKQRKSGKIIVVRDLS